MLSDDESDDSYENAAPRLRAAKTIAPDNQKCEQTRQIDDSENKTLETEPLSQEVIDRLGKRIHQEQTYAPPIHREIAVRWEDIINHGLPDEEKTNLLKKYDLPENCKFSNPPKMNGLIKAVVSKGVKERDDRICLKQEKISACLGAVSKTLVVAMKEQNNSNKNLEENSEKKSEVFAPMIEYLNDAIKLLADLQLGESSVRRSLILANINPSIKSSLVETKCDEYLFGEKLDDTVKVAKSLELAAKDLRSTPKNQFNNQPKNFNGPRRPRWRTYQRKTSSGQNSRRSPPRRAFNQNYRKKDPRNQLHRRR